MCTIQQPDNREKFSDTELERMRETQTSAMQDLGFIQDWDPVTVSGEEQPAWTERSDSTPLGINMLVNVIARQRQESRGREMDTVVIDGQIRLPLGVSIDVKDRIRIVKRYGQPVSEMIVAVASESLEGPSGIMIDFVVIEPGVNR